MESLFNETLLNYFEVLKKFSVFTGRSRRREFWLFFLANFAIELVIGIFMRIPVLGVIITIIFWLYMLAIAVPGIALGIRRLHDTDKSGWFMLLCLMGIGAIIVLVFCAAEGTAGDNKYGPDPKSAAPEV